MTYSTSPRPAPVGDRRPAVALVVLLLAAGAFYFYTAARHAPVTDEAIFGRASLAILDGDWSLSHHRVMKPPLVYYLQAASRAALGDSAFAGRVPGILATLGCLLLLYRLGRRWFDAPTGLLAAALMAASPFVFEHMPNARTDAIVLFFVMLSIDLIGTRRFGWAGLAFALAFCTKQQAAFSFPLVLALAFVAEAEQPAADRSWWRRYGGVVWTFFKGTLPALILLFIWSAGEKIPFAWLINELQNKKYSEGAHLTWTFGRKLLHWLSGVSDFFAYRPLAVLAAMAVSAALATVWRRRGKRPEAAILALFACLFVLLHSLRFFTIYLRFLVPLVPWVFLLTAWLLVSAARRWRTATPVVTAIAVVIVLASAVGLYGRYQTWNQPWPEDDIPRAVRWIAVNTAPGALLYTREYGSEVAYANWRTRVESKQIHGKLEQLGSIAAERVGREQFLFLSDADDAVWRDKLTPLLAPVFALQPVTEAGMRVGRLYRLALQPGTGIQGETIVFREYEIMKQEPLSCEVLGRLFRQALAGGAAEDFRVGFEWQVCEPAEQPGILAWKAMDIPVGPMRAAHAAFYYDSPQLDWNALALPRRLVVNGSREARAEFILLGTEITAYLSRKNKNLDEMKLSIGPDGVRIAALAKVASWRVPVAVVGTLALAGNRVLFEPVSAEVASVAAPAFALAYAAKLMNPVVEIDLSAWGLRPRQLRLLAAPTNALVLITERLPN